ncbi:MAG: SDR family oxidoreductase [Gemmatimonadetes bacterium]|nr:SDR family oxidoreductase [Gemmatimonadota bacterium]
MSAAKFRLDGKTAVVTGAGSGIGLAIARTFAAAGANVHLVDISAEAVQSAAHELVSGGATAWAHPCDVSSHDDVARVFADIHKRGPVQRLVNSAGVAHIGNLANTPEEDFDRLFRVNVKGSFLCMQAVIDEMQAAGEGAIVNIASVAATVGIADRFAYSMTKGAVVSMTLSVAKDYAKHGIRCNAISPARVHTPFVDGFLARTYPGREAEMFAKLAATQPIGRMGRPEEVADLALFLCSDEASFITGSDYPLDGGFIRLNS